jgi:L-threonylcarbamoyladenylate synthase
MNDLAQAVGVLRRGGLVAFPTETVYGLGADATNPAAVEKIFSVKGRPPTNPLIVHVADETTARRYAADWPDRAHRLARRFWPGPLTLVVGRGSQIAKQVGAGRDTVGLRVPDHPLALRMLEEFAGPVAAPSANRSTHVSATTAEHVRYEFGPAVDFILDGGPCFVGIESTVLDLSTPVPTILRPGSITQGQIETVIGPVHLFRGAVSLAEPAASPGQHALHYAPRAPAYRLEGRQVPTDSPHHALLALDPELAGKCPTVRCILLPREPVEYARVLYASLRAVDQPETRAIYIQMPPDSPEWSAVRDRLMRATRESCYQTH